MKSGSTGGLLHKTWHFSQKVEGAKASPAPPAPRCLLLTPRERERLGESLSLTPCVVCPYLKYNK